MVDYGSVALPTNEPEKLSVQTERPLIHQNLAGCARAQYSPGLTVCTPYLPYFEVEHNSSGSVHKPPGGEESRKKLKMLYFQWVKHKNGLSSPFFVPADGS